MIDLREKLQTISIHEKSTFVVVDTTSTSYDIIFSSDSDTSKTTVSCIPIGEF